MDEQGHTRCCAVPGCTGVARSHKGRYCENHRQRWRRHGHARQQAVTKAALKPYLAKARKIIGNDPTGKLVEGLSRLHDAIGQHARQVSADHLAGKPLQKWGRIAAQEAGKVMEATSPTDCAAVVTAMFLMQDDDPGRFADNQGFRFQLVRMFRAQTDLAYGSYWDHRTGSSKTVYRDLPHKATASLGELIVGAYSRLAAHVVAWVRAERAQKAEADSAIDEAFSAMSR